MKNKKMHFGKEIGIMIVLTILILLIVAVAFYDFIPSNINIPEPIQYSSDSKTTSIKQEIAYTNGGDATADGEFSEEDLVTSLKSYSIQASDLTVYGQKNLYNSGNSNPFDYAEETTTTQTQGTTEEKNASSATDSNSSTDTKNNSDTSNSESKSEQTNQTKNYDSKTTESSSSTGTFFEKANTK